MQRGVYSVVGLWIVITGVWLADLSTGRAQPANRTNNDAATRQYATAVALQNRDQFDLAADEWQKFLTAYAADSRAARARHYRGLCLLKLKQYAAALPEFQKLLDEADKLPPEALVAEAADGEKTNLLPATYLYAGLCELNLGQNGQPPLLDRAQKTFAALAKKEPQGKFAAQAFFYQGEAVYAAGRKAEALPLYERAAQDFPKDPIAAEALYARGVTQAELSDHVAADATFARFLKQFADHRLTPEVKMRRGEALLQQNQLEAAQKLFAEASSTPGFSLADHALIRQAFCQYARQQYAAAATIYASVPTKFPNSPYRSAAALGAAKCAYQQRQYPAARAALAKLTSTEGDIGAEATHWLARAYLKEKQPADAERALEPLLKRAVAKPEVVGSWLVQLQLDLADALYDQPNRQRDAAELYARLARDNPSHELAPQALYLAAFADLATSNFDAAAEHSAEFLKKHASHELAPEAGYVAAEAELLRGRYALADAAYAKLLTAHAKHRDAPTWQVRRALALVLDKKYAEAVKQLEPLARQTGDKELQAEAAYLLGNCQVELQQPAAARTSFQTALAAAPRWRQADETLLALAGVQRQENQLDAARASLQRLVTEFPKSALVDRAVYRQGEYAYAAGDYAAAQSAYRRVVADCPKSPLVDSAKYGLAWAEYRAGDKAAALKTLDGLLSEPSSKDTNSAERASLQARARYARAVVRHAQQAYAGAIEDLHAYLKSNPAADERSDARYLLGLCQAAADQNSAAIATFQQLVTDDPRYAGLDRALNELAWAHKANQQPEQAADIFARLVKERPDSPLANDALYHVAEYRYGRDDFKQAARDFYKLTQQAGTSPLGESATHMLGWAYFKQNEFADAGATFASQRQKYATGELASDAAYMEGESLAKQGKYSEALACYAQVKQPKSKSLTVLAALHAGQAATQLKQYDAAIGHLERAARLDTAGEFRGEILYEQGWAKQNLGKADEALKLYEAVTDATGAEAAARARFMIGEIYFERREHDRAIKEFFKVANAYSYPQWQAAAEYEAGRCFEVLGKLDQAKQSYQEVVRRYPASDRVPLAQERLAALGSKPTK